MSDKPFLDTTVLIYAVSNDQPRASVAQQLLQNGGFISVQVLNEFAAVARRKLKKSWQEISDALLTVRGCCEEPVAVTVELHDNALKLASEAGCHIYDALMVAAALHAGCKTLLSEDMQDGRKIK